jgi:hypothetical protein
LSGKNIKILINNKKQIKMKRLTLAFAVGLLTALTFSFSSVKSVSFAPPPPPPQTNLYMASFMESQMFKNQLQQALLEDCNTIATTFQGQTSTEAIYKLKFVKGVMNSISSPEFKVALTWLTTTSNHTDISDSQTGFGNCKTQFNNDIEKLVKSCYSGITW